MSQRLALKGGQKLGIKEEHTSFSSGYNMAPKPNKTTLGAQVCFSSLSDPESWNFPASSQAHMCLCFHKRELKHTSTCRLLRSINRQSRPEKQGTMGSVHTAPPLPCRCQAPRPCERGGSLQPRARPRVLELKRHPGIPPVHRNHHGEPGRVRFWWRGPLARIRLMGKEISAPQAFPARSQPQ